VFTHPAPGITDTEGVSRCIYILFALPSFQTTSGGVCAGGYRLGASWPRVSVVILALNEAENVPHVFARLPEGLHEVILVDGHSIDGTIAVAQQLRPDLKVVAQDRRGKGNALACGFAACEGDIVVMLDADGSTDPAEIPRFIESLRSGADFAKGSRFVPGEKVTILLLPAMSGIVSYAVSSTSCSNTLYRSMLWL
jgi:glycosyltransferase involved in cell wall biosynthesis